MITVVVYTAATQYLLCINIILYHQLGFMRQIKISSLFIAFFLGRWLGLRYNCVKLPDRDIADYRGRRGVVNLITTFMFIP